VSIALVCLSYHVTGDAPRLVCEWCNRVDGSSVTNVPKDDLLSCVTITISTHLTFVSAQFKQVCSLTSGRIYYTMPETLLAPAHAKKSSFRKPC
jgi:hypothetical protein